jgi:hypothetical protein
MWFASALVSFWLIYPLVARLSRLVERRGGCAGLAGLLFVFFTLSMIVSHWLASVDHAVAQACW